MSLMTSFCVVIFTHDVLDEIRDLIVSVSEGFPTYSYMKYSKRCVLIKAKCIVIRHSEPTDKEMRYV